jgi:hypothetical protein
MVVMANLDVHFDVKRHNRRQTQPSSTKWSGRRTIGVALLSSAALWALIFWTAKALLV